MLLRSQRCAVFCLSIFVANICPGQVLWAQVLEGLHATAVNLSISQEGMPEFKELLQQKVLDQRPDTASSVVQEEGDKDVIENMIDDMSEDFANRGLLNVVMQLNKDPALYFDTISIVGNQVVSLEDIQKAVQIPQKKRMRLSELKALADKVTRVYQDRGWVTSYAYIPVQEVRDHVVEIRVMEGLVGQVRVEGNKRFQDKIFQRDIQRRMQGKVLNYNDLKVIVRDLDDHPERTVKAHLVASEQPGMSDIVISVEEQSRQFLNADMSNTGTKSTGLMRYGAGLHYNNFLGQDDQIVVKSVIGKDISMISGFAMVPVMDSRTRVGVGYSDVFSRTEGRFAGRGLRGKSKATQVFVQRTLQETLDSNVQAQMGLAIKESVSKSDEVKDAHSDLAVVSVDFDSDKRYVFGGRSFINAGVDMGIEDFLGSYSKGETNTLRAREESGFMKYRGQWDYYQKVWSFPVILHTKMKFQTTNDILPSQEQMSLTGFYNVRGFDEGAYLVDKGGVVSVESFFPLPFVGEWRVPFSTKTINDKVQWLTFFDYGVGSLQRATEDLDVAKDEFKSVGFGFRIHIFANMYGRIEFAYPIHESDRSFDEGKIHFVLQTELF